MMKTLIQFRLRQLLDADLIAANVPDEKIPDLCRDGLRLMLGIRTTRQVEVKERPLHFPQHEERELRLSATQQNEPMPPTAKPVIFVPGQKK